MLRRKMTSVWIRCIIRQRYKKSVAGRARGDMNPPRENECGFAFFRGTQGVGSCPPFPTISFLHVLHSGTCEIFISGITNGKRTEEELIDIVQPVSSSLPKRMDLNPTGANLVGFFFACTARSWSRLWPVLRRLPTACLILVKQMNPCRINTLMRLSRACPQACPRRLWIRATSKTPLAALVASCRTFVLSATPALPATASRRDARFVTGSESPPDRRAAACLNP